MKDISELKKFLKGTVDKIKSVVEKEDIPLAEAYDMMDRELEEAERAYGKKLFPDDEKLSLDEHYLKLLGFKEFPGFDVIKASYEKLVKKFNPENFEGDEEKQMKAAKKINLINQAYSYFEEQNSESEQD